jgi:hypothetical protein
VEAMFLKMKNGGKWGKIQRNAQFIMGIDGWTDINNHTIWVVEWGLLDSMKLKHKMKL